MNDYQRSCLGTVLAIGLFFVVGLAIIGYSLLVTSRVLPSPAVALAASASVSDAENVAVAVAQSSDSSSTIAVAQASEGGQAIFEEKCIICHTIGGGTLVGPDLQGVTTRRDNAWLSRWILEPDAMIAEGDPIATELLAEFNNVPMINQALTEAQVAAVIAYLAQAEGSPQVAAAPPLPEGNAAHGAALFTGAASTQNGAPSCISCHSTTGVGTMGGGTLGPDLTNVHTRYGADGLAATLRSLPFPTMQGIFTDKPLTDNEVADLYAYFVQTDQIGAQSVGYTFVLIGLGGCLLLAFLSHLIWRKRLTGVRIPLLGGAK